MSGEESSDHAVASEENQETIDGDNNVREAFVNSGFDSNEPEYPGDDSSKNDMSRYLRELSLYTKEILSALIECDLKGEELWYEAARSWTNNGINNMGSGHMIRLRKLLWDGGLAITMVQHVSRSSAILACLRCPTCPLLSDRRAERSARPETPQRNSLSI